VITADARCTLPKVICSHHKDTMYRMIGMCGNCRQDEILVMFTGGHAKRDVDCPVCGCYNVVTCYRLATEEEIPVA